MNECHRGRVARERSLHDLSRIDRRLREGSPEHHFGIQQPVLRVEEDHEEDLVVEPREAQLEPVAQALRPIHHGCFAEVSLQVAQQQLLCKAQQLVQLALARLQALGRAIARQRVCVWQWASRGTEELVDQSLAAQSG